MRRRSEFLLVCTAMLALFLGFTKRRQEAILEELPVAPPRVRPKRRSPDPCSSTTRCRSWTR